MRSYHECETRWEDERREEGSGGELRITIKGTKFSILKFSRFPYNQYYDSRSKIHLVFPEICLYEYVYGRWGSLWWSRTCTEVSAHASGAYRWVSSWMIDLQVLMNKTTPTYRETKFWILSIPEIEGIIFDNLIQTKAFLLRNHRSKTSSTTRRIHSYSIRASSNRNEEPRCRYCRTIGECQNRSRKKGTSCLCHVATSLDSSILWLQWPNSEAFWRIVPPEAPYVSVDFFMNFSEYIYWSHETCYEGVSFRWYNCVIVNIYEKMKVV